MKTRTLNADEQYKIKNARLCRKACDLEEVESYEYETTPVDCKVVKEIVLSRKEMKLWTSDFFIDREEIARMGGSGSDWDPDRVIKNIWDLTEVELKLWRAEMWMEVIRVKSESVDILIDPQGYNYSRYVAINPSPETPMVMDRKEVAA